MTDATRDAGRDGARFLLTDNVVECSNAAAGYLQLIEHYYALRNPAGMKNSLKCAVACIKAAVASFNELEEIDAPQYREGAAK
jgi:hypothetical protein